MIKKFLLLLFILAIFKFDVHANNVFGAGIYIGSPTGIKVKMNLNKTNALSSVVAWDINQSQMYVSVDYSYNFIYTIKNENTTLPIFLYTGPGIRVMASNNAKVGIKFTGGAGFKFSDIPLEFFLEVSPILDVFPATELGLNAGIGFILYFL